MTARKRPIHAGFGGGVWRCPVYADFSGAAGLDSLVKSGVSARRGFCRRTDEKRQRPTVSANARHALYLSGFPNTCPGRLYLPEFQRVGMNARQRKRPSSAIFRFMFFDALSPAYLGGFRAFYVFCTIFIDFRGDFASLKSGSTLPKDKAGSR